MKKILFAIEGLNGGGAEKVFINLLNNMNFKDYKVTVVLLFKEGIYLNSIPKEVEILSVFNETNSRVKRKLCHYLLSLFGNVLYKKVIKDDYDYEISFLEGLATKFIFKSDNEKSKKLAWIHTDMLNNHWTKRYFFKNEEEVMYNKFNKLAFVSNETKNKFYRKFTNVNTDGVVSYNIIDTNDIIKQSQEYEVEENIDIIAVGRLCEVKGYDILIKAFSYVVKEVTNAKLTIIGDGELRDELANLCKELSIEENVVFTGFVKNPYPYLKKAKVFVMSSRTEGFPTVLCEAITLDKLIISTRCPGSEEILDNGKYGLMVDQECIEDLSEAIKTMLLDENINSQYLNSVTEGKKIFDVDKRIIEFDNLLKGL